MVRRKTGRITILFLFTLNCCFSGNLILINGDAVDFKKTIFLKQRDTLTLMDTDWQENKNWYEIIPIQLVYSKENNCEYYDHVKYEIKRYSSERNLIIINENLGTRYFAKLSENDSLVLQRYVFDNRPIHLIYKDIFQVVVRKEDSYLGYLTELINIPFILPPTNIRNFGHQTDLRIGSDCAELAIYGKRRVGNNIPYVGPNGIRKFLELIDKNKLFEGCIIHFGYQVSVLFQDNGIKGQLDENDVLIQSYENKVCLITYRKCGFYNFPYKPYRWK